MFYRRAILQMVKSALCGLCLCSLSLFALAETARPARDICADQSKLVSIHCGLTPSGAYGQHNRFWTVFEKDGHVYLSYSDDFGKTYSPPVKVNVHPESIYTNGENRPKLALGIQGELYISWTKKTEGAYAGDIRFSRSLDNGKSFDAVKTLNDDGLLTSHRFDAMQVDVKGDIYVAWLDKRDRMVAEEKGAAYSGAAVYYTFSADQGKSFAANRKLADHSCECCRLGVEVAADQGVAILWRHIFPENIRDHALAVVDASGIQRPLQRASYDHWRIEACPHHGPAISRAGEKNHRYHLAWFTNAESKQGIYYAHYDANTQKLANEILVSDAPGAGRPFVLQRGTDEVWLVWKAFDGEATGVHLMHSKDNGANWQRGGIVARTAGASDYPFLHQNGTGVYLQWQTENEGMRLLPLMPQS